MDKIDSNESCPLCQCMGDHTKNCPNYPEEWKKCKHIVKDPRTLSIRLDNKGFDYNGCCLKCGMPVY